MRTVFSIVRLSGRVHQVAGNDIRRHTVQDGAVKEKGPAHTSLGVARNLHLTDRQITDAPESDGRFPSMECAGDSIKDKSIGTADVCQAGMQLERQHECVGEASRTLKYRASAACPPEDRNSILFTGCEMHVLNRSAGSAQHDEKTVAFPKPEHRIAVFLFQFVQECLIKGKIFHRCRQGEVEQTKRAHGVTAWR